MENDDCNKALLRIFPKINLEKIKELFDSIPEEYNSNLFLSNSQRKLYRESIEYKWEKVFDLVYNKLQEKIKENN